MTAIQDNAYALTATADAITAQANTLQTSQLHYQGCNAHNAAAAAWNALVVIQKTTYHQVQAATHLTCAAQLKAAGR
jgi:hypothetical protein